MRASSFVIFSVLVTFCFARVTIRIPKRVLVTVDRFEDADGNARVGREFAIGYHEKTLDDDEDYYSAVECGVVHLDVRVVHRCDCRTTTTATSEQTQFVADIDFSPSGTAIEVSYSLFLYVDDDDRGATYFSASVNGDVVVSRDRGSASVPGEWFNRDSGLIGPNRPRTAVSRPPPPQTTGDQRRPSARKTRDGGEAREGLQPTAVETIDMIDERAFKEWLRQEFSDDRVFGAAAAADAGNFGRPTGTSDRDQPCVELPEDRVGDFRDSLPATGCYRLYSERRCTGVSKMLFWHAENLNEDGALASTPVDHESPSFRVESVTGCCWPRREKPLDGDDVGKEPVWSTSFSADGDYSRSQNNISGKCECGPPVSTTAEPSADNAAEPQATTVPPESSSNDLSAPSTTGDISTETTAEPLPGSSTEPLANIETKYEMPKESLSSAIADDSTRPVLASSSVSTTLSTDVDILTEANAEHLPGSSTPSLANAETKNEIPKVSLSSATLASTDISTEPTAEPREDNIAEPLANAETKDEIPTESSSNDIADNLTASTTLDSPTSAATSEFSTTTTVSDSTVVDPFGAANTEKLDESSDDSDATGREEHEAVTISKIVVEAKEAVSVAWNFLTSFAQKCLTSTWSAYKLVQHALSDDSDSSELHPNDVSAGSQHTKLENREQEQSVPGGKIDE